MQNYVILVRSQQGGQMSSASTPSQAVAEAVKAAGGNLLSADATSGSRDFYVRASFPDTQSAFKASAILNTQHGWITETESALPLVDFDKIYSEATRVAAGSASTRR